MVDIHSSTPLWHGRSKPTKATAVIHQIADGIEKSGYTVDWDSAYSTVSIECEDHADASDNWFLQGEEADQFINELQAMCKQYPSLDERTAALCLVSNYI